MIRIVLKNGDVYYIKTPFLLADQIKAYNRLVRDFGDIAIRAISCELDEDNHMEKFVTINCDDISAIKLS